MSRGDIVVNVIRGILWGGTLCGVGVFVASVSGCETLRARFYGPAADTNGDGVVTPEETDAAIETAAAKSRDTAELVGNIPFVGEAIASAFLGGSVGLGWWVDRRRKARQLTIAGEERDRIIDAIETAKERFAKVVDFNKPEVAELLRRELGPEATERVSLVRTRRRFRRHEKAAAGVAAERNGNVGYGQD